MKDLIHKFWTGKASRKEKEELLEKLSQEKRWLDAMQHEYEQDLLITDLYEDKNAWFQSMRKELHLKIAASESSHKKIRPIGYQRIIFRYAAVLLTAISLTAIGLLIFPSKMGKKQENPFIVAKAGKKWIKQTNLSPADKILVLNDHSRIRLRQGSEIYYEAGFGSKDRQLYLEKGSAIFSVAKNKEKPFCVSALGTKTTVLGTRFSITVQSSVSVKIKLYQGRVKVNYKLIGQKENTAFLNPGRQITVNREKNSIEENSFEAKKSLSSNLNHTEKIGRKSMIPVSKSNNLAMLSFNQCTMDKVLDNIAHTFHVNIIYKETDMRQLWFSGTFSASEGLEKILRTICQMNNLSYKKTGNEIIIVN